MKVKYATQILNHNVSATILTYSSLGALSVYDKFLSDMLKFIKSSKVIDRATKEDHTNQLKCLHGLCLTINRVKLLWSMLRERGSIEFLMTRRLNQDPLENFFGSTRQQGGNSDNPSPLQFTRAFRKLFYDHCLVLSSGNCTEDIDAILLAGSKFEKASKPPV